MERGLLQLRTSYENRAYFDSLRSNLVVVRFSLDEISKILTPPFWSNLQKFQFYSSEKNQLCVTTVALTFSNIVPI